MKLNIKHVVFGLALLVLFWTGNIIYYKNHAIDNPIFLKHYYDVTMDGFSLYYLDDINSKAKVVSIDFPQIGCQCTNITQYANSTDNPYYRLNVLLLIMPNTAPDKLKNKVITYAKVTFSDGKTMDVNLGTIHFSGDGFASNSSVKQQCSESSDYTGDACFTSNKSIEITGIDSKSYERVKDIMQINIGAKPLSKIKFPIRLNAGDLVDINYKFNFEKDPEKQNNAYSFALNILTKDSSGKNGITPYLIDLYPSSPKDIDLNSLKNTKGGN